MATIKQPVGFSNPAHIKEDLLYQSNGFEMIISEARMGETNTFSYKKKRKAIAFGRVEKTSANEDNI